MLQNSDDLAQIRIDMAAALRMTAKLGMHEGICNHFSVLLADRRFLINPKGMHFSRARASDLIVIDEYGRTEEGSGEPPDTGFMIHTRMHLNHPSAKVVLHLHAPYSTAITAMKGGRLEMVHQNATRFWGEVAYDEDFNGLARDPDEGNRMAAVMGAKRVLFLANHGVIVVGDTVAEAFDDFYYLERAAQVQVLAMQSGAELNRMTDEMAEKTHRQFNRGTTKLAALHLEEVKKILAAEDPSFAS